MSKVNKLQLVDGNKLTAVLELIKQDLESKKILERIKEPEGFILEEKKLAMEKKNGRQGENIVEFIKNKNSIKRKTEEKDKEEKEKNRNLNQSMQDRYSENFNKFLEKRNYQIRNGRIRIGTTWVNKDDLLYDISHMAEKPSSFNLQKTTHEKIFRDLKKKGMAASLIRNRKLRDLFKEARPVSALSPPTSARSSSDSEYGHSTNCLKNVHHYLHTYLHQIGECQQERFEEEKNKQ